MSKAADLAKTSTKAGFNYFWGLVISTLISSVGTIFIARLLGSEVYGLYGIVLSVPALFSTFRDWGINSAIVRYTAQYRAEKREADIRSIFITGIIFEITVGLLLSLVSFFMAGYIAENILHRPEITLLIQLSSFSILATGLISAASSIFTGTEKTIPYSIVLTTQTSIKTLLTIGLVIIGYGLNGAITGLMTSIIIAGLIGLAFTLNMYRKLPKPREYQLKIKTYLNMMLKYSTPISIASIISGFLTQFYFLILSHFWIDNALIGNYNLAQSFVILISFFALPITNMLFPAFSKLDINKDQPALKNVFQYSIKYASLIVLPVTTLVMCLATPAVNTLFPNTYDSTPLFLTLLSISYLFTAMGSLSTNNIINSQGKTSLNLKLTILTAAIGIPLGYLSIMKFGVFGLILTSTTASLPSLILSLIWLKKHYNLTVDWTSSIKILTASTITATLTYLIINQTTFNHPAITLAIGTILYILILLGTIILTKSLSTTDLNNLRSMTTGIGPITKITHTLLNILEKIITKLKLT